MQLLLKWVRNPSVSVSVKLILRYIFTFTWNTDALFRCVWTDWSMMLQRFNSGTKYKIKHIRSRYCTDEFAIHWRLCPIRGQCYWTNNVGTFQFEAAQLYNDENPIDKGTSQQWGEMGSTTLKTGQCTIMYSNPNALMGTQKSHLTLLVEHKSWQAWFILDAYLEKWRGHVNWRSWLLLHKISYYNSTGNYLSIHNYLDIFPLGRGLNILTAEGIY